MSQPPISVSDGAVTGEASARADVEAGEFSPLQRPMPVAREQHWPEGTLYVIATPIGNLRDITLRALDCIARLDALGAEDTRLTQRLLASYQLRCTTFALHQHNEEQGAVQVIERLARGERIGYVSDAGTPGVSDPGARLVAAVERAGFRVVPIPGVSALTAAVSVAGLPSAPLVFLGFLPSKVAQAKRVLEDHAGGQTNLVLYEAPHRIEATLVLLASVFGASCVATLARELTKQFETITTAPLGELPALLKERDQLRGEFVIVLHARGGVIDETPGAYDQMLGLLLDELTMSKAVALATKLSGAPRNQLYARALELKAQRDASAD